MDPVSTGPSIYEAPTGTPGTRAAAPASPPAEAAAVLSPFGAEMSAAADVPALLDPANRADPEREQELTLHFMSHVSADCFVSLLQTMDPMPSDEIKRAEWRRFYGQLDNSLIVPVPPSE